MSTTNLFLIGSSLFLSIAAFGATAKPSADTVITKAISADRITRMKVVGNIDLVIMKGETDKAEITGAKNLATGLTWKTIPRECSSPKKLLTGALPAG